MTSSHVPRHPFRAAAGPARRRALARVLAFLAVAALPGINFAQSPAAPDQFRLAFTGTMMSGVNDNDGKAALKAWAASILTPAGIAVETLPSVLDSESMIRAFQAGRIDGAAMITGEYLALSRRIPTAHLFVGSRDGELNETYLLLVSEGSSARRLADLRGSRLTTWEHARMSLAWPWLAVLLSRSGLARPEEFFGSITPRQKPNNAVLPVFFGTADTCIVTRRGFEGMIELNPQVGKRLRVLAESPPVIPSVFCFRASFNPPWMEKLLRAIRDVHKTPAGMQIITMYQFGHLEERSADVLQSARALMDEYTRAIPGGGSTVREKEKAEK
jgi:ABC-type phosphate/phosphonate transport system substrate-binding protein